LVDIIVEEVAKNRDQLSLRALNVRFVFTRRDGFIRLVSKSKPEAQVYDPAARLGSERRFLGCLPQGRGYSNPLNLFFFKAPSAGLFLFGHLYILP